MPSARTASNFHGQWQTWRLGVQRARWSYAPGAARTFYGVLAPGAHGGSVLATGSAVYPDDRGVYWYYSLDGGSTRVQFQPGDPLSVAVADTETITIDADFRDPRSRRPGNHWIGGPLGEGIQLVLSA